MNQTIKRLIIYVIFCFVPVIVMMALVNTLVTKNIFALGGAQVDVTSEIAQRYAAIAYGIGVLGMFVPSVAHLLTRLVTKEGFQKLFLWGKWKGIRKYFVFALCVPMGMTFIGMLLIWRVYAPEFGLSDLFYNSIGVPTVLLQLIATILLVAPAFGEEWGWRAYMMPKLTELMGKPMAVLVGGIIWGLWHAPFTVQGHNFGVDYPGFPYVGILIMCVFCTCMNAFLTLLTEKTQSIYAASIAHMVNNNLSVGIWFTVFARTEIVERISEASSIAMILYMMPMLLVMAGVSMYLLVKKEKKKDRPRK